jgi:hypothetical protein
VGSHIGVGPRMAQMEAFQNVALLKYQAKAPGGSQIGVGPQMALMK